MRTADPRGTFYTPSHIVDLIVERTVGPLCDGLAYEEIPRLRILDPSCGEGAFLTGAYSYLRNRFHSIDEKLLLRTLHGVDLDESALKTAGESLPGANLKRCDSLLNPEAIGSGFHVVIGNPPWTSLTGRFGIEAYSKHQVEYLKRRFAGNSYAPNLFEYFIQLGLELTRPGGYFSYIVPDRLASNKHYADLRGRLLAETEILHLEYGIPFPGVTADTLVFVCRKSGESNALARKDGKGERVNGGKGEPIAQSLPYSLPPFLPFNAFPRPDDTYADLPGSTTLGDVFDITSGFGGRASLVTEERVSDSQIETLRGSSIVPYAVRKRYWFDFRPENITGRTTNTAKLGASPKILIRKTGNRLIAAYDDSGAYPEQSLYFLYNNRSGLDWKFILGILNSAPMQTYYRARCLTNRQTIAHAKKQDLERIPLPPIDLANPDHRKPHDRIVKLVDNISPTGQSEIDAIVRNLYGLEEL